MRARRALDRDINSADWPKPNKRRIARARRNLSIGLREYFPDRFYNPFTEDQREMIEGILHTAKHGGDQAIAATRGDGKTSIAECVIVLCIALGWLRFPVIVAATGRDAEQILQNIKAEVEQNEMLAQDFPGMCMPVRALEGAPQRAGGQTVDGVRTRARWSGDGVRFPVVKGSLASGAVLMTRGLDGAMRGLREGAMRPDFALIDDADTEESAASEMQQTKREATIDRAIGGMAGPGKSIGRVLLGTLMNRTCLAARYTDATIKPSWQGRRFRFVKKMPTRDDLWGEYMRLRQEGFDPNSDVEIDASHKFYSSRRRLMDAGAVVSNPHRFTPTAFPPEVSALQHFYNEVADKGWPVVLTELQNDPPNEDASEKPGLTPALVQKRLSGTLQNVAGVGRLCTTAMIDVGQRKGCHFTVVAWYAGARGVIIDYGVQDVNNIDALGPQRAVLNALHAWREERLSNPYADENGEPIKLDLVLVDSGDGQTESAVMQFAREAGHPYRASKGFGSRTDLSPFRAVLKPTPEKRPGEHWFLSKQPSGMWLVGIDSDHWKEWTHDRFLTQPSDEEGKLRAGSLTIYGDDPRRHSTFAHHICAEQQEQEFVRGKGVVRKWVVKNRNNDWLDSTAGACCAGSILGVRLSAPTLAMPVRRTASRARIKFAG